MAQASNYYTVAEDTAPADSAGYTYASNNQGIPAYYQTIQNWFAGNPSQADTEAAMQQYGVSAADIQAATGRSLDSYYNPPSNYVTNVPTPAPQPVQQPIVPTPVAADNPFVAGPTQQTVAADNPFVTAPVGNPPSNYVTPQAFTPPPAAVSAPAAATAPVTSVQDYRGVTYDTATLANLAKQVAQNIDTSRSSGGAFGTNKENIGFDYNTLSSAYNNAPLTTGDQVAFDMARQLIDSGITNLNQIKAQTTYNPVTVRQGYDDNGNPTGTWYKYIDQGDGNGISVPVTADEMKTMTSQQVSDGDYGQYTQYTVQSPTTNYVNAAGQPVNPYVGVTYTGPGHTNYYYDAPTGKFYTTGESSSTFGGLGNILPLAGLALNFIVPGAGTIIGEALGATGVGASMLGNAVIGGALSGAAGGDVLKGALTGGAAAGLSNVINPAIAENITNNPVAANTLTGGAVSGILGGNPLLGAASSGVGSLISSNINPNGTITATRDDGSTITYDKNGNVLGSTVSPYQPAPVVDLNPPLNILSDQQTADLMNNVNPNLINSFTDTGAGQEPFKVEIGGLPGTAENPGYSVPALMTPGTHLATFDEIDAGLARWNPAANAWEIGGEFPTVDENTGAVNLDNTVTGPVNPNVQTGGTGGSLNSYYDPTTGNTTQIFDDGSTLTTDINNNVVDHTPSTPTPPPSGSDDEITVTAPRTPTPPPVTPDDNVPTIDIVAPRPPAPPPVTPDDNTPEVVITAPRPPAPPPVAPPTPPDDNTPEVVITAPRPPAPPPVAPPTPPDDNTPEVVITAPRPPVAPPVEPPSPPPVEPPTPPVTPPSPPPEPPTEPPTPPVVVPPIIVTPPSPPPVMPPAPPTPPVVTPTPPAILGKGLNPGYIQPTDFYKTYAPVQSKFFWGQHGYQEGPTFNAKAWNQAPAPETPWGIQATDTGLTAEQMRDLVLGGKFTPQAATQSATRMEAANPASMVQAPAYGQRFLNPAIVASGAVAPTDTTANAVGVSTDSQYRQVAAQLGNDWSQRLQKAAESGDWATYYSIQSQVYSILHPDTGGGGGV